MSESGGGLDLADVPSSTRAVTDLSLTQLREYRRRLSAEEDRVSYWRRLLHARIDVLEAQRHQERPLGLEDLVRALGDTAAGHSRRALVTVQACEPLPQLPVLREIWVPEVDPDDQAAVSAALERLRSAERQLTEYRRALHARIDEATTELIMRYHKDPTAALAALPEPRRRPRRDGTR